MQVKKFRGATMQAALDQVRAELGQDAVILNTRTIERGGLFGWRRKSEVEICASPDVRVRPQGPRPPATRLRQDPHRGTGPGRAPTAVAAPKAFTDGLEILRVQIEQLAAQAEDTPRFPTPLRAHYRHLVDRGVNAALARRYLRQIHDRFSAADQADALKVRLQLIDSMRSTIRVSGPIVVRRDRPTVIALVGPTGVGKTTTIAKLAADFAIGQRRRVGLITADTYRIAAVEQLRVYADILDLPVEVVLTPTELKTALARFHNMDVVLMDTAGRSPQDTSKLHELEAMVRAANADHIALCLSATTHQDDVPVILDRFSMVPPHSLILTKVDETMRPGWILNTCATVDTPIAFITTGQNVPDDIEVADATRLIGRVLGEEAAA